MLHKTIMDIHRVTLWLLVKAELEEDDRWHHVKVTGITANGIKCEVSFFTDGLDILHFKYDHHKYGHALGQNFVKLLKGKGVTVGHTVACEDNDFCIEIL